MRGSCTIGHVAAAVTLALSVSIASTSGDTAALALRAAVAGAANAEILTITLFRWSTDEERTPLLAALLAPPAPAAEPAGGRAGRGGRGGRGAAPPPSPLARLTAAVRAAPTVGYIWGGGITGYSIKYAWHSSSAEGRERIVLVTDRRLGAHAPHWALQSSQPPDSDFTLIEMSIDGNGAGHGKTSLTAGVTIDQAANTLALDGYAAAPAQLVMSGVSRTSAAEVTR